MLRGHDLVPKLQVEPVEQDFKCLGSVAHQRNLLAITPEELG